MNAKNDFVQFFDEWKMMFVSFYSIFKISFDLKDPSHFFFFPTWYFGIDHLDVGEWFIFLL